MAMQDIVYFAIVFLFVTNYPHAKGRRVCKDQLPGKKCIELKKFCASHYSRMKIYCPETCNYCDGVCRDVFKLRCKVWVWHGACKTHTKTLKKYCKKSCGFCGASAPPKKPLCAFSPFGCCWDKVTKALGPNGLGCKPCKDKHKFCRKFFVECIYGRNLTFMRQFCPATCRLCRSPNKENNKWKGQTRPN